MKKTVLRMTAALLSAIFLLTCLTVALSATESKSLDNEFPVSDESVPGVVKTDNTVTENADYRSSAPIAVNAGDVVYLAPIKVEDTITPIVLLDSAQKGVGGVSRSALTVHENMANGYAVYRYTVPANVAYIRVVVLDSDYNRGDVLVTLNQAFTEKEFRTLRSIPNEQELKEHVLYGKRVLFVGDSISYGGRQFDPPTYRYNGGSWAARFATETGAVVTNASVPGASMTKRQERSWIYEQYKEKKDGDFDLIVMHGGVNDAIFNSPRGNIRNTEDETKLEKNIETFAGGMQWLFYHVTKENPQAELFYIANYRLDGYSRGQAKHMEPYFEVAQELCEKYGITYIDLFGNAELNEDLASTTTKYLPDYLHVNSQGYDMIFPHILDPIVKVMEQAEAEENTTATTATTAVTTAPETTTAPQTTETPTEAPTTADTAANTETQATTDAPAKTDDANDAEKGGCKAAMGGVSGILLACAAAIVLKKRKK